MRGVAALFTDTATVATCTGNDPNPVYDPPVEVACYAQRRQERARDPEGRYVPTSMIVYAPLGDADKFKYGTKVTAVDHFGYVITTYRFEHGPRQAWHVKVMVV